MNLSKSRYTKAIQCPKILWMDNHMPEQHDDSVMRESVLKTGNEVGDLAMGYYGDFIEVEFCDHGKSRMIEDTQRHLDDALAGVGPVNIAEASFSFDGNFCSVDILRVEPDGVHIVEVKSSTHVNPIYYHDMAFQTWVLTQCGLNVKTVSLMHVDSSYVRQGELDLQKFMVPEDCTEKVMSMQDEVAANIPRFKAIADMCDEPEISFGAHCSDPYDCGYCQYCWKEVPSPSVFDVNRLGKKKAMEWYDKGVITMEDVANSGMKLSKRKLVQVECEIQDKDGSIDVASVGKFLDGLSFPLYFLDFETVQPAIPLYDGTKPFQQIPTQYSLHVIPAPGAQLEHYEFLAQQGQDPRRAIAERLVKDIPADVCVLAYNMNFEKGRISELAASFPDLADHLLSINGNVKDLIVPFNDGSFYARQMGGSNSIKAVLPALFPDDPELDYHALEGVQNGSQAMDAFANLVDMDEDTAAATRESLLRYCELDTLAMVKIWQKLAEAARPELLG